MSILLFVSMQSKSYALLPRDWKMNSEETIKEITPVNLQKGHCQHDYLHDFIMDAHSTILRNRKYKDESCRLCYGEPEATYSNYFEPLSG